MYCQIIPNNVLIKIITENETDATKRIELLNNVQESIRNRYKRSVIYNNRTTFLPAILDRLLEGMERLWFYDCNYTFDFPGDPSIKKEEKHDEDIPIGTIIPQSHVYNMDETYDFFRDIYGRKSFNGDSATVKFYSNYGRQFENAFWDGEQMVFGNGSRYIREFGSFIDVVAHEFTHAVTQYTSELIYEFQSGALNEHMSDVFGSLVKQYLKRQTAEQADWLIGEGLWRNLPSEYKALRSMKDPGTAHPNDSQPAHMSNIYDGSSDNGGVHINSGIPNKAFYLASVNIGGNAWEKTGLIWFKVLEDSKIPERCTFKEFARATYDKAKDLYPDDNTASHIKSAWQEVGVEPKNSSWCPFSS